MTADRIVAGTITSNEVQGRNRCLVYSSNNQALTTSGTYYAVAWNSEQYDSNALHDNASSNTRITVPSNGATGVWYFSAMIMFQSNATGARTVRIVKNASILVNEVNLPPVNGEPTKVPIAGWDDAPAVGDYYEIHARQTSGGSLNIGSGSGTKIDGWFAAQHSW